MDNLTATSLAAMEHTAISGLCREEQLGIGVQAARKRRPDVSRNELLELAREAREQNRSQTQ